jgi:hypothetical protein
MWRFHENALKIVRRIRFNWLTEHDVLQIRIYNCVLECLDSFHSWPENEITRCSERHVGTKKDLTITKKFKPKIFWVCNSERNRGAFYRLQRESCSNMYEPDH